MASLSDPLRSALLDDLWLDRALLPDRWMCPFCLMERELGECAVCVIATEIDVFLVAQDLGLPVEGVER